MSTITSPTIGATHQSPDGWAMLPPPRIVRARDQAGPPPPATRDAYLRHIETLLNRAERRNDWLEQRVDGAYVASLERRLIHQQPGICRQSCQDLRQQLKSLQAQLAEAEQARQRLSATIEALQPSRPTEVIRIGRLTIDPTSRRAALDGRQVRLTPVELQIVQALVRGPDDFLPTDSLACIVWGWPDIKLVNVNWTRLKARFAEIGAESYLRVTDGPGRVRLRGISASCEEGVTP